MNISITILMISLITPMMNHPLTLGAMLMIQTIMICLNLSIIAKNSWYSYILFITIIGGLMIMFMYMASIASNEKFKKNLYIFYLMITILILMILTKMDQTNEIMNKMMEFKLNMNEQEEVKTTMKFFNMKKSILTTIMMLTLLLTMISITKISSSFEGPLKKTYV